MEGHTTTAARLPSGGTSHQPSSGMAPGPNQVGMVVQTPPVTSCPVSSGGAGVKVCRARGPCRSVRFRGSPAETGEETPTAAALRRTLSGAAAAVVQGARMRVRVGVDVVDAARVTESIETFGDRYLQRVFTAGELADAA